MTLNSDQERKLGSDIHANKHGPLDAAHVPLFQDWCQPTLFAWYTLYHIHNKHVQYTQGQINKTIKVADALTLD